VEFRILGPLEVVHDGRSLPLGGTRERAVLALLLLSPNRVVSAERLAEDLWGDDPPERAVHSLRVFVSRLRKALREAGSDEIVLTQAPGYLVRLDPVDLDVARFERLVASARDQGRHGDHDRAAATLREALGLWRGPALADVADAPLARAEAARLEEIRQAALEERVEADLACGRHQELTAELDALTRAHPLREHLWAQRMVALYRSDRQAEALRAYRELRALLAEELGLEPSAALARLEGAILRHDRDLDWPAPETSGQLEAPQPSPPASVPAPSAPAVTDGLGEGPVTILFTDVEASTDLRTRRGDQVAQHLLRDHEEIVRSQVEAHGGREVKALGDGFMVAFTSARRALSCAVGIQRTLEARRSELPEVRVRIGLNTGEVVREGDDLYGQSVHAAARIAAKAAGGEILVSEVVKQLAGTSPDLVFRDRGQYRLKGFPERFRLYEVPWRDEEDQGGHALFAERTPYVGREAERSELVRLLDGALRGHGALVMIGGEPGVGKTRLTEEIGSEAKRRGMRVRVGRCYEMEGAPPYVPFVEILEQAMAAAPSPAAFRELLSDDAPEVAKLLPHLRRVYPDIPPALELPAEQERRYLFNSVRDFLARAASARPAFVVFDDLHWADEPTLLLLEHLAEQLPEMPVLAVGTYRDTEVTPGHPLARTFDALSRRSLARRINLRRLAQDGVAGMLLALSGQEPPPSLVQVVHAETEGNPFFVEEVFKHLAEEGRLLGPDGRFRPEVVIGELDLPESLRLVLGRRLEHLGEDGRRALAAAAVVGRAFTYELLEALGELQPDALLDALDEAERARLVAPLSDAPDEDRLLFSHELIRQTLLAGLSQPRRRRLHLLVADTLERLHADTLDDHASEIAHHLTRAGPIADRRRLLTYLTLAGRRAMSTAGYEDALRHFEQAVAIAHTAEPAKRPGLFAGRALARRSLGRYEEALPDWEGALHGYEELGDSETAARMCLEASRDLWWLNRDQEALVWAERGLAALGDQETPQRAQMLGWTGVAGACVSPYEHGAEKIDEALALAERLGDKRLVGYGLVNRALHRGAFSLNREVLEAGQEGIRLLRAEGDLWEVATLLAFMEVAAVELGRMRLAAELGEEVETLATRLGHSLALSVLHEPVWSARQLAANPDLGALEASALRHLEVAGAMGFRHWSGALLSHAAFLRGDWDEALGLAEEAVHHSPEHHSSSGPDWGCYLRVLAYCGRAAEVVAILDGRRADLPQPGRPNGHGTWYLPGAAIEALSVIGERDRAAGFYPLVREFMATTGVVLPCFTPYLFERIAGIGAAAGRQWELAEQHFRRALHQAEELPFALEGAETRRCYARMLLDRNTAGDRDRARSLVEQAVPVYRRIGMPRHEEMTRALLTPAG
jgi:DNA-binding SARP family transcriptional activator/class 3 adenylate cyclase/tetratricopeptide (TPR) repeat protein